MFRIVIKRGRSLKIGLYSYTYQEALEVQKRMISVGHKNILVISEEKLFN